MSPLNAYWSNGRAWLYQGYDLAVLRQMPDGVVQTVVTSPPYFGLRDYGCEGQRGAEASPAEYVAGLVELYREVRRVLKPDGVFWLNIGDIYSSGSGGQSALAALGKRLGTGGGQKADAAKIRRRADTTLPPKNLTMIPARTALALQDDGWIVRNDIIWRKPLHRTEAGYPRCATCDGGGCPDCTDPA